MSELVFFDKMAVLLFLKICNNLFKLYILYNNIFFILGKHSFSRKESTDSGISMNSRKTSTQSNISIGSILEEPSEDTIKEEVEYVQPDEDLCEKITQQVFR
jgi:hypothetical protein